jgi:insulysin
VPKASGLDVRAAVAEFHSSHYSANLMRLAVYGRQPLEELQSMVSELFSEVPNQHLQVPSFPGDLYLDEVSCCS